MPNSIILLTFFWSRQIANFVIFIAGRLTGENYGGDENYIEKLMSLPQEILGLTTFVIGVLICGITVFKFIPKNQRLTFIISGIVGGTIGFVLWMVILGPIVLP